MDKLTTETIINPRNEVINQTREIVDILTRKYLEFGLDEYDKKLYYVCRRKIYSAAIGKLPFGDPNRKRFETKIKEYNIL